MEILRRLAHPGDHFDHETVRRARTYLDHVSTPRLVELTPEHVTATARVTGTSPTPYAVHLEAELVGDSLDVMTWCSCPVQLRCKHGAALCLALGHTFAPPTAASPLDRLLDELADLAPSPSGGSTVGLQVALAHRSRRYVSLGDEVQLRPLRPGKRQAWARTGLGWSDVVSALQHGEHDRAQLQALDRIRRVAFPDHWYSHQEPTLADLGPSGPELLARARDAGVVLVPVAPLRSVEIADEPFGLVVDAGTGPDGAAALRVGLRHEGRLWHGPSVTTVGDPAAVATLLEDGRLVIGSIDPPLPPGPVRALRREEPVRLGDRPDDVLRRVGSLVRLDSTDGTVAIPEPVLPRLRVSITWLSGAEAEVRWAWLYGDASYALGADPPAAVVRDPAAERALLAHLDPAPIDDLALVTGVDTLHLALLEVPAWRAVEGVEVVEHDRPDFRESEEAPELSFVQADPGGADGTEGADEAQPGPTDWLDLEVLLTVEGERLALPDLLAALTRGDEHVVLPSGLFVRTDRPEFARLAQTVHAAAELRERDAAAADAAAGGRLRVSTDDLGTWAELADLGQVDTVAADWVSRARALRDLVDLPEPHPVGITSTLRPYQLDGLRWLLLLWQHDLGGVLADDMGLGKTLQVLSLVAHARAERPDDPPFLVVAPTSVVGAWVGEAARHAPHLRVRAVTSSARRRGATLAEVAGDADVVVTSYTLLRLGADDHAALRWSGLVLDEAQQVKNHQSKAYAAARGVAAPFRLAVTGTPFENRLMELWSLLSITSPGLYPRPRTFVDTVVTPVEKLGDTEALGRLTRRIKPFVLRRTKELVAADLPPKQEQVREVVLSPRHRKIYDAHLAKERQRILGLIDDDFDANRVAVLAALTRLRQLALDPALVDDEHEGVGSAKIDDLVDHLRELAAEGHRALVFSQFTGFLGRVRERLTAEGIETAYLDGRTRDRPAVIEAFRTGTAPAFLISLKAGGVGLTLTEADYVFVLDPWWNPAAEAQAVDRAHRIGQHRTVMVYRLVSTDTIEEKVMVLKARKAQLFAQVLDGEAGLSAAITAADVRGLFD